MTTDPHRLVADAVLGPDFVRATFAGVRRSPTPCAWQRVTVRPVELRGERQLQFAYFDGRQTITKNFADASAPLAELLAVAFSGVHVTTTTAELDVRTSKKGKVSVGRKSGLLAERAEPAPHNRTKDVPLPEGRANPLLEAMGVTTRDGRVRPTMRAKFTQINEFLKHLRHALDDSGLKDLGRPLDILDCGCGSSYLTLAAHHYLNESLKIPARILGVDVNPEIVRKSTERAGKAGASGLSFACGTIRELDAPADIVFALHACDTATDDALAQAVRSGAKLVLCVPCCHHALNKDLRTDGVLHPMLRHGILRERTADIVTDAFRALALRVMGYRVDVVEFVSPEHTARNLMIRAVKTGTIDAGLTAEYLAMKEFWGVTPYIEKALGAAFAAGDKSAGGR